MDVGEIGKMYTKLPAGLTCSEKHFILFFILGTGKIATWITVRQDNLARDNSEEKVHDTFIILRESLDRMLKVTAKYFCSNMIRKCKTDKSLRKMYLTCKVKLKPPKVVRDRYIRK